MRLSIFTLQHLMCREHREPKKVENNPFHGVFLTSRLCFTPPTVAFISEGHFNYTLDSYRIYAFRLYLFGRCRFLKPQSSAMNKCISTLLSPILFCFIVYEILVLQMSGCFVSYSKPPALIFVTLLV